MKQATLSDKEIAKVLSLREQFPKEIGVAVRRSEDGGFVAQVLEPRGVITEANTFSELIEMVNDAVYSYLDVPEKFASFMPSYMPPVEVAQRLNVFPVTRIEEQIKLSLPPNNLAEAFS